MKNYFKTEDFLTDGNFFTAGDAALIANEKLNILIKSWPIVYGTETKYSGLGCGPINYNHFITSLTTHKARLAFIEPIIKTICIHEPMSYVYSVGAQIAEVPRDLKAKCVHCNIELVATWSEKK